MLINVLQGVVVEDLLFELAEAIAEWDIRTSVVVASVRERSQHCPQN
jgi:hypothetical protein